MFLITGLFFQIKLLKKNIKPSTWILRFELCHFKKIKKELPCRFKYSDMANKLDPMDLKQILTLHLDGYSKRKTGSVLGISRNTVNTYMQLFARL